MQHHLRLSYAYLVAEGMIGQTSGEEIDNRCHLGICGGMSRPRSQLKTMRLTAN